MEHPYESYCPWRLWGGKDGPSEERGVFNPEIGRLEWEPAPPGLWHGIVDDAGFIVPFNDGVAIRVADMPGQRLLMTPKPWGTR